MQSERYLAIFDLDGTLVDSVAQIGSVLNATRQQLGYPILPQSFYRESLGLPLDFLIADLVLNQLDKNQLVETFRENLRIEISLGNNPLFPGVKEVLDYLVERGISIAIATSKPTPIALAVVKHSELAAYPIKIQGTDNFPAKPAPDVIRKVLQSFLNIEALMVGDRIEDILAARAAGINSIGIAASAHSQTDLKSNGATEVFLDFIHFSNALCNGRLELFR